ncbi:hypothetical protein FDECE_12420 [Fusarium decemcellulare]|nr:hypothetical protein FDECE_12420 [Fusarium decemcellulare]
MDWGVPKPDFVSLPPPGPPLPLVVSGSDPPKKNHHRPLFPEWSLPDRVVLKVQKEGWDEEFDLEKAAYEKLRALQGITIPRYLGAAEHDGIRAMVLSDIGGHCIPTPEGAVLDPEDFKLLLHEALTSLTSHGVSQDDTKLDNFHHVIQDGKDKIMIVDLEMVSTDMSADEFALGTKYTVDWLTRQYRGHRKSLELERFSP